MSSAGQFLPHDFASYLAIHRGQMKQHALSDTEQLFPLSVIANAGVGIDQSSQVSYFGYTSGNKQLAKKPARKVRRRKWRKPKDKPKRPLSAYNLFFRDEREQTNENQPKQKLGFAAMGRMVASRWKHLEPEKRKVYEERAQKERNKYFDALAIWRKKNDDEKKQKEQEAKEAAAKLDSVQLDDFDLYDSFASAGDDAFVTHGLGFGPDDDDEAVDTLSGTSAIPFATAFDREDSNDNSFLSNKLQMALDCSVKEDVFTETSLSLIKDKLLTDDVVHPSPCPKAEQDVYKADATTANKKGVKFQEKRQDTITLTHPFCAQYGCLHCPIMKRILKTFETLRHTIDDEFVNFMSNLDWSEDALTTTSVSSASTTSVSSASSQEEQIDENDNNRRIKMEDNVLPLDDNVKMEHD